MDAPCELPLENSPESPPEVIQRQKQCLGWDSESQLSDPPGGRDVAMWALLQCPLGLGVSCFLRVLPLCQLRSHLPKDGVQVWLLVRDWRAVRVPMRAPWIAA